MAHHKWSISLENLADSDDVVTYGVCYISVTTLPLDLLQDFGMCQYLGTGSVESDFVAWGGTNKNRRVK